MKCTERAPIVAEPRKAKTCGRRAPRIYTAKECRKRIVEFAMQWHGFLFFAPPSRQHIPDSIWEMKDEAEEQLDRWCRRYLTAVEREGGPERHEHMNEMMDRYQDRIARKQLKR